MKQHWFVLLAHQYQDLIEMSDHNFWHNQVLEKLIYWFYETAEVKLNFVQQLIITGIWQAQKLPLWKQMMRQT